MANSVRIGNAQAFWGDSPRAPARLLSQQPDLDFLTLDYLSEVSLSIMAIQREKDSSYGYARDFIHVISSLIPFWKKGLRVKVITNAGGMNPMGCAESCAIVLRESGIREMKIGVVSGDDVLPFFKMAPSNPLFCNLETRDSLNVVEKSLVSANAYLGARGISDALDGGSQIVITGRVADPSLTVGPCVFNYHWSWEDYDRLAGATIAGHLIECGTQVTGGISTMWLSLENQAEIGFPFVEMQSDGSCVVAKPNGTGGLINEAIIKEQLLYEIGDPKRYLSPDVTVSFLEIQLETIEENRVRISGAKGSPPPSTYKVSASYRDGFKCEALLTFFGKDIAVKARLCGEIVLQRVKRAGYELQRTLIECLGSGDVVPGVFQCPKDLIECVLRISVADQRKEALECFAQEVASLVTSGPQGVTGYTSGRPQIRPVFGYWPCLINVAVVDPKVEIITSKRF